MSAVGLGALLVTIWVLLWGSLTWANVLAGVIVGAVVLVVLGDERPRLHLPNVRIVPAARFVGRVLVQVVNANWVIAREVVSRRSSVNTGVVDVALPRCSDGLLTLITSVLALTPGTMPVSLDTGGGHPTLTVHVLHLRSVEAVQRDVQHLAELAYRAFGARRGS